MTACGLDFGTSNSAIGIMRSDTPSLAPVEGNDTLIPSAVFFDYETKGRVLFGVEAIDTYVGQHDGRLMRALKSILGSPLIDEKTALGSRMVALTEVVEIFVRHLKLKAEAFAGEEITSVVHGRPVRFVENDDVADAKAERVLAGIANRVGFRDVAFVYEPMLLELIAGSREPEKVARLLKVIRARLGHRIAFAVENTKIELSEHADATVPLDFVERELWATATRECFDKAIASRTERLHAAAAKCVSDAGLKRDAIQTIFFTGGSSRVPAVSEAIAR